MEAMGEREKVTVIVMGQADGHGPHGGEGQQNERECGNWWWASCQGVRASPVIILLHPVSFILSAFSVLIRNRLLQTNDSSIQQHHSSLDDEVVVVHHPD